MSRQVKFTDLAWEQYIYWQKFDNQLLAKINRLIDETRRNPFIGTGKPEPLRENYSGFWSRRITDEHRLVYAATETEVLVVACRYHYSG